MRGFDRLAKAYQPLERLSFANRLQTLRCFCIPYLTGCRNGLLIGNGDGRFSAKLLQANSSIRVDSIDISRRMLEVAQANASGHSDRLNPVHGDALKYTYPETAYDFIGLHFCLDCFSQKQIDSLLPKLTACLRPGGVIAYSDFQASSFWQRAVVRSLYLCFRAATGLEVQRLPNAEWPGALRQVAEAEVLAGLAFSRVLRKS
ncbi:class I SAM-dependent methyltransferase [Pelagicoccus sp. NFK12]|uniref:Class I SAM-dependent methyltransferase n=1 Tax=Pelagicoccus enzymogenes TaxID=2773457 RepID=A0A927F7P6_9BACT|nr:class I SAM-dependent methyltransferase [Pelagicoccus enzymogenes]MBD5778685.1 class I SAM-dependent methyltransferase [Pelagicoccus enzymogenes]